MNKEIHPFLCSELFPLRNVILYINIGNLYWLECLYLPAYLYVFTRDIAYGNDAPNTITTKQFWILFHIVCPNRNMRNT